MEEEVARRERERQSDRERQLREEEERLHKQREEEARQAAERRKKQEAERQRLEAKRREQRRKLEEDRARIDRERAARRKQLEEERARIKAERERRRKEDEERRLKRADESRRVTDDAERQRLAKEERDARRKRDEERRKQQAEEDRRMREEEARRKKAEQEALKRLREQQAEQRRLLEEQQRAEERQKAEEAERKRRAEELRKQEEEARRKREEARRQREEQERNNSNDGGESVDNAQQAREQLEQAKREEELRQKRRKALLDKQRKIRERKRRKERKQRQTQEEEGGGGAGGGGGGGGGAAGGGASSSRKKDPEELFKEIEAESKRTGKKWTDTSWTGKKALYMNPNKPKSYGVQQWKRPEAFLQKPTFATPKSLAESNTAFTGEEAKLEGAAGSNNSEVFTADAIQQGMLGDCWFLSAMGIIADDPAFMKPLFVMREITASGAYVVRFHKGGKIRKVIVDDKMPCDAQGGMAFVHSDTEKKRQEIWMMVGFLVGMWECGRDREKRERGREREGERERERVNAHYKCSFQLYHCTSSSPLPHPRQILEKAYAKLHGSYEAIEGGFVHGGLIDLCGGAGEMIEMNDRAMGSGRARSQLWNKIKGYRDAGFMMGCGSHAGSDANTNNKGIVQGHAYAILRVVEETDRQGKHRLVCLRNPWGQTEWKGKWGDKDRTSWSRRMKSKLKYDPTRGGRNWDDGTFWMCWADFLRNYEALYIGKIYRTSDLGGNWHAYSVDGEWKGQTAGGVPGKPASLHNPQYSLMVSSGAPQTISVTLKRDADCPEYHINLIICNAKGQRISMLKKKQLCHELASYTNIPT